MGNSGDSYANYVPIPDPNNPIFDVLDYVGSPAEHEFMPKQPVKDSTFDSKCSHLTPKIWVSSNKANKKILINMIQNFRLETI